MNEFLDQLVRGLTNAYSRSQKCLVSVHHLAPQISEAFSVFLVAGGKCYKSDNSWSIWTVYALSFSLSACFLRTRFMMSFAKDKGLYLNAAALEPMSNNDTYGKLLSPNHLWSLPAAPHSDLSARQYKGVISGYNVRPSAKQHVIRGCFRSFSATASLRHREGNLCGSCGRKTYPETVWSVCKRHLIHSGGAGLRILGRILDLLLAKKNLAPRWCSNLPNTLGWRYALHAVSGVFHHSIQCFSHPSVQIFQPGVQSPPDLRERL